MWAVVNEPGGTGYGSARVPGRRDRRQDRHRAGHRARRSAPTPESLPFKFRDHAWFTSFAPAENPELVVVVFAEHGGAGSRVAAPIAQAIYAKYFEIDLEHHRRSLRSGRGCGCSPRSTAG